LETVPSDNLTGTQKKIVSALRENPMTAGEFCKFLGVEYGSVFPEFYHLMLLRDADRMKNKGIKKPILFRTKDKPAKYVLDPEWRLGMVKE
jgi:hypothetical protein